MLTVIRVLALASRVHAAWPDVTLERAVVAASAAVREEGAGVTAELELAIAQHESDLEPTTISYVIAGHRVDVVATSAAQARGRATCGYMQSVAATREQCASMLTPDGGMRAGADELREWLGTCRGDLDCALRGYAGGTRCALDARACSAAAATFAKIFRRNAEHLSTPTTAIRYRRRPAT